MQKRKMKVFVVCLEKKINKILFELDVFINKILFNIF